MKKVNVSIDNYVSIPALIDPDERWNGWACPWFDPHHIPLIQKTLDLIDNDETLCYDSDDDAYVVRHLAYDDDGMRYEYYDLDDGIEERYYGKDVDGQHLYPIGNGLWVWRVDE